MYPTFGEDSSGAESHGTHVARLFFFLLELFPTKKKVVWPHETRNSCSFFCVLGLLLDCIVYFASFPCHHSLFLRLGFFSTEVELAISVLCFSGIPYSASPFVDNIYYVTRIRNSVTVCDPVTPVH